MNSETSPFGDPANRLARPIDQAFASLMDGTKAVVRVIGPRRIGKTDLVCWYARTTKAPVVRITTRPLAPDVPSPAPIVCELLRKEIASLKHTAPKLHAAYAKIEKSDGTGRGKTKMAGEVTAIPGIKVTADHESAVMNPEGKDADVELAYMLRRLELAAERAKVRPIVFFDEVQELIVHTSKPGLATIWAIRNEAQHHTFNRYVFAGSNQRIFGQLQEGAHAPLLHFGSALTIPPLTAKEIDAWAVPLFARGGRHLRSLETLTTLLCGKIGEVAEVCNFIWANSPRGSVVDEEAQRAAVFGAARAQIAESKVQTLTPNQAIVLRWVFNNPDKAPYAADGLRKNMNPGTIREALARLVDLELIEAFGQRYSCTTPLRILAAISPSAWTD